MRRTLILTALGAATLSIGLGVGATMAEGNSTQNIPIDQLAACEAARTSMMGAGNGAHMQHGTAMASMMAPMMGGSSPVASHAAHAAHHQEVQP